MEFAMRRLGIDWKDLTEFFRKLNKWVLIIALYFVGMALMNFISAGMQRTTELDAIFDSLLGVVYLFISWQMLQLAKHVENDIFEVIRILSSPPPQMYKTFVAWGVGSVLQTAQYTRHGNYLAAGPFLFMAVLAGILTTMIHNRRK